MKLTHVVWMAALVACKPSAEKCFEARDKARAAWLAAAGRARAEQPKDEGASGKMQAALDTMKQIPATLWPCLRSRAVATGEPLPDINYVTGAPDEVRERMATAKQLAALPSADAAAKAAIAKASAELDTALPELEKQVKAAKPGRPSPALVAAAKRIDVACTQLLDRSAAIATATNRSAKEQFDAAQKVLDARLAELERHDQLMKEILYAAAQVGSDAPPEAIGAPKSLANDPRFAEAQRLTQVARERCKK